MSCLDVDSGIRCFAQICYRHKFSTSYRLGYSCLWLMLFPIKLDLKTALSVYCHISSIIHIYIFEQKYCTVY